MITVPRIPVYAVESGAKLIIVNRTADLVIHESLSKALGEMVGI
jgi:hypothetical protein